MNIQEIKDPIKDDYSNIFSRRFLVAEESILKRLNVAYAGLPVILSLSGFSDTFCWLVEQAGGRGMEFPRDKEIQPEDVPLNIETIDLDSL